MESPDEVSEHRVRGLVSLEGDTDAISVQLRLLPPSSKVMVLLPLSSEIQRPDGTADFNARSYTRLVHETLSRRIDKARSFLQSSTINQPRLVFMNGGCLSARMICISTICENVTKGDIRAAEMLFDDFVKDGVASLLDPPIVTVKKMRKRKEKRLEIPTVSVMNKETSSEKHQLGMSGRGIDFVMAAIKAADALYRDTASLQPSMWDNLDMTKTTDSPADMGDTSWDISQDLLEFRTAVQVDIKDAIKARKIYFDSKRGTFSPRRQSRSRSRPTSTEVSVRVNRTELSGGENRPKSEKRLSLPPSLPLSDFGGACVFDPQSAQKTIKRPHSVGNPSSRTSLIPTREVSARSMKVPEPVKSSETGSDSGKSSRISQVVGILPRTSYVRLPETKLDGIIQMSTSRSDNKSNHVDHGTDAEDLSGSGIANHVVDNKAPTHFRPLFAIVEELVVHVSSGEDNEIFESVIRSYKHGGHPNAASPAARIQRQPVSPTSFSSPHDSKLSSRSSTTIDIDEEHTIDTSRGVALGDSSRGRRKEKYEDSTSNISDTKCPAQVGTPKLDGPDLSRYGRDSFSAITNAVGVQNSIRALLNVHFPPKSTHYRQHMFPLENDRFWKPIFSNDDSPRSESKTVDLMLALGIEEGVDQNFCKDIVDRVEKLGVDGTHGNRIRKLDIRYLVIRAMETFTSQPLAFQAGENPFKQPSLLATLMVPHLEIFLSCNEPTSILLLYYPPSHLATVLALRELVGSEKMKVAGIVNSLSHFSKSNRNSYASVRSRYSEGLQARPVSSNRSQSSNKKSQQDAIDLPSYSKADFLLLSTATDSQISYFLTSIFLALPGRGSFYLPSTTTPSSAYSEPHIQPYQPLSPISPLKPLSLSYDMGAFPTPPRTLYSPTGQPLPPSRPSKKPSKIFHKSRTPDRVGGLMDKETRISPDHAGRMLCKEVQGSTEDVARTIGRQIGKEMLERTSERLRREREAEKEWSCFSMDSELEEYDEWERIFLPQMAKRVTTPQKALRWLGLT